MSAGGSARVAVVEPVAPAPAVAVTEQPSAAEAAAATIKRVSSYMARTMMRRGEGPVTVLYGTDRAVDKAALPLRSGEPPRLDYSAERAGTLTFGRAQVAVSRAGEADGTSSGALEVSEIKPLEHDELLVAAVKQLALARKNKDHALVFVHGFNTTFDTALYRAAGIAHELKFDGPVFIYSWPSAGHVVRYAYDTESAAGAKPFLGGFLKLVMGETGASSVTIIAQGLGAAPVMEALAAIKGELPAGAAVSDVILAAPDLDRETFATRVRNLAGVAGRVTLYAAASDRALNISRRYAGAVPRAGDVPDGGPMVLAGVETVDITEAGIGAIGQAIAARGSAQPGTPRPEYEAVATPKGAYWRYIKATRQR